MLAALKKMKVINNTKLPYPVITVLNVAAIPTACTKQQQQQQQQQQQLSVIQLLLVKV